MELKPDIFGGKTRTQKHGAFTLLEVLCSIAIAAIVTGILFGGFNVGFGILKATRDNMRATQILMQKTEAFRLYTWKQLTNCPTSFQEYYYPPGLVSSNAGTLFYGTIQATGVATNIPDGTAYKSDIHLITVTVHWTNNFAGRDISHVRQMQTLNSINGMQSYLVGAGF